MHHVVSKKTYYFISLWLFVLLVLTVAAAMVDLGAANVPIALGIACAKAVLILLYFMHIRYSAPLVVLFATAGFFWLFYLIAGVLADVAARLAGW